MNISTLFLAQIGGLPGGGWIVQAFNSLAASISASWDVEHTSDGGHSTIRATGAIYEHNRAALTAPRNAALGEWINVGFDASRFSVVTGTNGTWTVNAPTATNPLYLLAYTLIGRTMLLNIGIYSSTLTIGTGGSASVLGIRLPDGYRTVTSAGGSFTGRLMSSVVSVGNGGPQAAFASIGSNQNILLISLQNNNDFSAGTLTVTGQIAIEVAV